MTSNKSPTVESGKPAKEPIAKGRKVRSEPVAPPGSREASQIAAAILEVLAGVRTPTQAAQVLSLSIPRYYLLEQRALAGLVQACEPRPRGPTVDPQREVRQLEKQLTRLQQECGRQQALVRAAQRTIGLAPPPPKPTPKPGSKPPPVTESGGRKRRPRRPTVRALKAAQACRAAAEQNPAVPVPESSVATPPPVVVEHAFVGTEEPRYLLNVRDLASGTVLAWEPVVSPDAAPTAAIIAQLFREYGPPLVLKSDNGSAFIAVEFTDELTRWNVVPLRSPPRCPQYNGSCEAGGGAMKKRTAEQATLAGHPDCWTMANLHAALFVANVVLHPQGANAPTPSELWQQRQPITPTMRAAFTASLERHRQRTREEANIAENDLTRRILFDQIDRVAIGRTLVEFDLVRFTRRSFTPPLNPQLLAKIT